MSKDSRTDHFFIYPRDNYGAYLGSTICVLLRDGRMYHGEAYCSPADQFEKRIGRQLAYDRAIEAWKAYAPDTEEHLYEE